MALFKALEYFVVTDIEYKAKGQTIVQQVTLAHLSQNGKPDGKIFKFGFNDFIDCPDFLILKQHYDKSCGYKFKPGDRVEMVLDSVFTGTVKLHQCVDTTYPNSEWNAMSVEWVDNEERCSIWDLQPAKPTRAAQEPTTLEDIIELGKYDPQPYDWPLANADETPTAARTRYLERCKNVIDELNQIEELKVFYDMVDLNTFHDYPERVKRPMYLQLISDRIRCLYYRSLLGLKFDIQLIAKNAHSYNEPGSQM